MTPAIVFVLWIACGAGAAIYLVGRNLLPEELTPPIVILAPISASVVVGHCIARGVAYVATTSKRREARTEADYREVLRLIEYQPKPRTAVDDVVDELEIESVPYTRDVESLFWSGS